MDRFLKEWTDMTGSLLSQSAIDKSTIKRCQRREIATAGTLLGPILLACIVDKVLRACVSIQQTLRAFLRLTSDSPLLLSIALMGVSPHSNGACLVT